MPEHVFVDETKARGYLVAAAAIMPEHLVQARKQVNELLLAGQRRLHFTKEKDSRRRTILSAFAEIPVEVTIYDAARHSGQRAARRACLECLVDDLIIRDARLLVIETDESLLEADRRILYARVREAGYDETLRYEHRRCYEESLLAIPDAIAWCWVKGGDWKRRAAPLVAGVRRV